MLEIILYFTGLKWNNNFYEIYGDINIVLINKNRRLSWLTLLV